MTPYGTCFGLTELNINRTLKVKYPKKRSTLYVQKILSESILPPYFLSPGTSIGSNNDLDPLTQLYLGAVNQKGVRNLLGASKGSILTNKGANYEISENDKNKAYN